MICLQLWLITGGSEKFGLPLGPRGGPGALPIPPAAFVYTRARVCKAFLAPLVNHRTHRQGRVQTPEATLRASLSGTFLQTRPDFGYATEGALFISARLSSDAVSALRKFRVLI